MYKSTLSLHRLPLIILAALLVISTGCQATDEPRAVEHASESKGSRAPDFTLGDLNGDKVSLGDLRGQPAPLNFWATW